MAKLYWHKEAKIDHPMHKAKVFFAIQRAKEYPGMDTKRYNSSISLSSYN